MLINNYFVEVSNCDTYLYFTVYEEYPDDIWFTGHINEDATSKWAYKGIKINNQKDTTDLANLICKFYEIAHELMGGEYLTKAINQSK